MKRMIVLLSALITLSVPTGCSYESREFTEHKAGVYKGLRDPLLAKERLRDQQQALVDRFKMVQTDR